MALVDSDDAIGFGFAHAQASLIGDVPAKITGVGTTQTGAAVLTSRGSELNPGASATAFVLPSNAKIFAPFMVNNQQTTTALVFVPSGHTLNSVANASVSVAQYASAIIWQYKPKNWTYK